MLLTLSFSISRRVLLGSFQKLQIDDYIMFFIAVCLFQLLFDLDKPVSPHQSHADLHAFPPPLVQFYSYIQGPNPFMPLLRTYSHL